MILSKKQTIILMGIVGALILFCLLLLVILTPDGSTPANTGGSSSVVLKETSDYGQDYIDKIIFVGDSTTNGLKAYGVLSGGKNTKQVWTPASGTMTLDANITKKTIVYPDSGEEISIPEAAGRKKPEYMVITLGVNGVSFLDEGDFIKYYKKLVNAVKDASPNTKIILQSIFPVTADYSNSGKGITNAKISTANTWVKKVAEECDVKYLDTHSVLKDSSGALPLSRCNGDGIHLNEAGFDLELSYIRKHGYVD